MLRELAEKYKPHKMGPEEHSYIAAYEEQFSTRLGAKRIMEIGVQSGRSLSMWRDYFSDAVFLGVDINKNCRQYAGDRIGIKIGSQEDKAFLVELAKEAYDIIIDDGGHTMKQQRRTFNALFPAIVPGGIYVIEDLHTSYWPQFGGGFGRKKTAITMLKSLVDGLHYRWWDGYKRCEGIKAGRKPSEIEKAIESVHFYDSICFIRKAAA